MVQPYNTEQPARADIEAMPGLVMLDFGTNWCGVCRATQPLVEQVLAAHPEVRHIKVEDGYGRALGRSFTIKLWPTLVFLRAGREVARLVRPRTSEVIEAELTSLV